MLHVGHCVGQYNVGRQPAVYWRYSTVLVYAVWRSAVSFFSTKEKVYTENLFFKDE